MSFKHKLHFKSLPEIGTLIISEPMGFNKSTFKINQDEKYFGRDIIKGNEKSDFIFCKEYFEQLETIQILPNADVINHASHGFYYLRDVLETQGWESEIEYILEKDGLPFTIGLLDGFTAQFEFDRISCKLIQNNNREIIKRLEDTDVDAFSNKALDGRDIEPCETVNVLLKAKPIVQVSEWEMPEINSFNELSQSRINPSMNLETFGVRNSFVPFRDRIETNVQDAIRNFTYIKSIESNTSGIGVFRIKATIKWRPNGSSDTSGSFVLNMFKYSGTYSTGDDLEITQIYRKEFIEQGTNEDYLIDETITINLPNLVAGESLAFYWFDSVVATVPILNMGMDFEEYSMKLTYTSTAIDSIGKGIRYVDLIKHNLKSLADVNVSISDYESGGEHYDNFCFSGLMLGQIIDKPFYNKFKELKNNLLETCTGHKITDDLVKFMHYDKFYKDELLATFEELPSFDSKKTLSKKYALKNADFKYKSSSTNRETNSKNTIDDVHTETQKLFSDKVDTALKIEIDHIRSAFLFEEARMRAFENKETTTLQNDNKLFVVKCVPVPPSYKSGFSAVLLMQIIDDDKLQILNNDENGDGLPFRWDLLGLTVGSTFEITAGENIGVYTVDTITPSVITLTGSPTFEGQSFITVEYFLNGVSWMIKTNEGYTDIEGVENPTNYANIDYHIGRNLLNWNSYFSTATKFKLNGQIKTTSFQNNGKLRTKKVGETGFVIDNSTIENQSIKDLKKITPFVQTFKVYAPFEKMLVLIEQLKTIQGYIGVEKTNGQMFYGYPMELTYTWVTEELIVELEEKYISDYIVLEDLNIESYEINNIYVTLFGLNYLPLIEPTNYKFIQINGVVYDDIVEFATALDNYINE